MPPASDDDLAGLQSRLNYRFLDVGHLRHALTHSTKGTERQVSHNQVLAHLGDAVIELAVRAALMERLGSRGDLSQLADRVVANTVLARKARDLGCAALLDHSLTKPDADKPMAEAFEAICGAIFMEAGAHALTVVNAMLREEIEAVVSP